MICRHCKKRIPDDSIICPKCKKITVSPDNTAEKGESVNRRNIAVIMTVCIMAVFFLLSAMPFVMGKKNEADSTSPGPTMDNSVVLPAETAVPVISQEPPADDLSETVDEPQTDNIPSPTEEPVIPATIAPIEAEIQMPTDIPVPTRKPRKKSEPANEPALTIEPISTENIFDIPTMPPQRERSINFNVPELDRD